MSAEMERALLTLFAATYPVDFGADQRNQLELNYIFDEVTPAHALSSAAAAVAPESLTSEDDRFAGTQAFYLGVKHRRDTDADVLPQLRELSAALLRSVGSDASISAGDPPVDPARTLVRTLLPLLPGDPVTDDVVQGLVSAFGPGLKTSGSTADQVVFDGPAAWLATLLLEFFTNDLTCRTRPGEEVVKGVLKPVMLVEVDVCTNQPFDHCKQGIDPTHWPHCNPYFLSVDVLGTVTQQPPDRWSAVVKEKVGCPFNGKVYETDLAVTMIEQTGLAAVAFDLAPHRTDPGSVTVDRGFLAATDEGTHRRIRVLKVYRIEDLDLAPALAVPTLGEPGRDVTVVVPMSEATERLIAAWSRLATDVTAAVASHCELHSGGHPRRRKPGGIVITRDTACQPAATDVEGQVHVGMSAANQTRALQLSEVRSLVDDQFGVRPPVPATLTKTLAAGQSTVLVSIPAGVGIGTYYGWVLDGSGARISPFIIYLDGL